MTTRVFIPKVKVTCTKCGRTEYISHEHQRRLAAAGVPFRCPMPVGCSTDRKPKTTTPPATPADKEIR